MICRKWSLLLLCLVMSAKLMASFPETICGSGTERVEARPGKHDLRQRNKNCV